MFPTQLWRIVMDTWSESLTGKAKINTHIMQHHNIPSENHQISSAEPPPAPDQHPLPHWWELLPSHWSTAGAHWLHGKAWTSCSFFPTFLYVFLPVPGESDTWDKQERKAGNSQMELSPITGISQVLEFPKMGNPRTYALFCYRMSYSCAVGNEDCPCFSSTWIAHQNGNFHMQHLTVQVQTQITA